MREPPGCCCSSALSRCRAWGAASRPAASQKPRGATPRKAASSHSTPEPQRESADLAYSFELEGVVGAGDAQVLSAERPEQVVEIETLRAAAACEWRARRPQASTYSHASTSAGTN